MTALHVRPARARDLAHLALVEDSDDGFVLVAGDPPVGFARVVVLDGHAHLDQLSVPPEGGREEIGAALVEAACERAAVLGFGEVTLMASADLPGDGPFYARHGFTEVPDEDPRTAHQLALVAQEEELGLARQGRRVLMRRPIRQHRTTRELVDHLPVLDAAPRDEGTVRLVVRRPAVGRREVLELGELDPAVGLVGDTWQVRGSRRTPDGSAHPDMQLNVINHRLVEFVARDAGREALAGDQLFLDLDLSTANLPEGTRLAFGEPGDGGAVIEVTDQPHNGCAKFISRFGKDAMTFVNSPDGKARRLRGLCARVVERGAVRPGDRVRVTRPA